MFFRVGIISGISGDAGAGVTDLIEARSRLTCYCKFSRSRSNLLGAGRGKNFWDWEPSSLPWDGDPREISFAHCVPVKFGHSGSSYTSDVNKDLNLKAKARTKDQTPKAKDRTKLSRPRTGPRT